jgi:hypothetical protein
MGVLAGLDVVLMSVSGSVIIYRNVLSPGSPWSGS